MKEDEDDDIHIQTENLLNKIQEQISLSEEALNLDKKPKLEEVKVPNNSKSAVFPKENKSNQNIIKIKDSSLEFVNLDEDFSKMPKNAPFNDFCSICSSKIYYFKYSMQRLYSMPKM